MTIGIAVIGAGDFGVNHVQTLAQMSNVTLVSVCDIDGNRAETVASQYLAASWTTDTEKVFSDPNVEGVIIATSEASHYPLAARAMEAKKHVLVEKPVCLDAAKVADLFQIAEANGVVFLPGHMLRYDASYHTIKQRLHNGELGAVYSIYARRNVPVERWALHGRTHPVYMALVHDIDIILWYVQSRAKRVFAMEKRTSPDFENPNIFWGLVEFENGVVAALETQWTLPNHLGQYLDVRFEMMTENGRVALQYPGQNVVIAANNGIESPDVTLWSEIFGTTTGALRNELEYFLQRISGADVPISIQSEEVVEGIQLAELLIRSAQTGQPIVLDGHVRHH